MRNYKCIDIKGQKKECLRNNKSAAEYRYQIFEYLLYIAIYRSLIVLFTLRRANNFIAISLI